MESFDKKLSQAQDLVEVQGENGNWNYDQYMHGMYNGMELILAHFEGREPVFKDAPRAWLKSKEGG